MSDARAGARPACSNSAPAHRPCPRHQMNCAVGISGQGGGGTRTQVRPMRLRQGHAVMWRGTLPTKERDPVVVESLKDRGNVDGPGLNAIEPRGREQLCKRI